MPSISRTAPWTPEKRAAFSQKMRAVMSDPAVRQKVSERTKEAMKSSPDLKLLRLAWAAAQPSTRKRFLDEIVSPVCSASPASKDDLAAGRG